MTATRTCVEPEEFDLRLRDRTTRLALHARTGGWRLDTGFTLALTGDLTGRAELWLERVPDGTVVHHLLVASAIRSPVRVLRAYRRVVRRGLWALKDLQQEEARAGLERHTPGADR